MLTRTITAIVSLILFIGVIIAGNPTFTIAMAAIILFMIYEVSGAIAKSKSVRASGFITGVLLLLGLYFNMVEAALVLSIIIAMIFVIVIHGKHTYSEMFSMQFMTIYITLFMSYIPRMFDEMGLAVMALVFIIAWGSDTAAYFCGTFFGKHKLIPKVSPKKTIEGSVGAVIFTALLCAVYLFILDKCGVAFTEVTIGNYIGIAVVGFTASILSQLGDLAASAIKRDAGIKDYGKIFPGHGGFMDRFDSVVFIAPIVYYLCVYLIK